MFKIHPFAAFRPIPAKSAEISCEPGMRLPPQEAARRLAAFPNSWLQVIGADVREKFNAPNAGATLFARMKNEKWICQDEQPQMYVYRQVRAGEKNVALIAALAMSPTIVSTFMRFQTSDHDVARQTWQRDLALTAHAEIPVLAYQDHDELSDVIHDNTNERPLTHFLGKDGATHTVWACKNASLLAELVGQLKLLMVLSGDEMFAREMHCESATPLLRAVALTPIDRVAVCPSHILVSGGDAESLKTCLMQLPDSVGVASEQHMGDPPSGFFDTYMASSPPTTSGMNSGASLWTRRRLPVAKLGHSNAVNWERSRFERAVLTPWTQASADAATIQIHSMNAAVSPAQLTQYVDSAQAHAAFIFSRASVADLIEIARGNESIPRHAATFNAAIPSGLFIQSIL